MVIILHLASEGMMVRHKQVYIGNRMCYIANNILHVG